MVYNSFLSHLGGAEEILTLAFKAIYFLSHLGGAEVGVFSFSTSKLFLSHLGGAEDNLVLLL